MIKFHEINGFNSGASRAAVTDNYVMMVAIAHAQEKTRIILIKCVVQI